MKMTTQINHKSVGSGHWSIKSIGNYCTKKGIELKQAAHVSYDMNYGFDYYHIDIMTGKYTDSTNSDMLRSMLGI